MTRVTLLVILIAFTVCGCVRDVTAPSEGAGRPVAGIQTQADAVSSPPVARGSSVSSTMSTATKSLVGDQAVADLNRWYNDTRPNCGSESKPAFLCTGITLRATQTSAAFLPWNPNPSSTGVSFSWMRSDVNFRDLVYTYWNGFIFYPKRKAVTGADVIRVRCIFPMDADTNSRPTLKGCGPSTQVPATSKPCGAGIATSAQWLAHFNALADKYRGQCGWDMTSGPTADRFLQSIGAHQGLPDQWWYTQNEMRMSKWAQNSVVPIRAFFYVPGHANALQNAQSDQRRYAQSFDGAFAPIIRLTMPASRGSKASFSYALADQVVADPGNDTGPAPQPGPVEDFEGTALTGPTDQIPNLKNIVLTSYNSRDPALSIENAAAPSMQGRHLVVRTLHQPPAHWYEGGFQIGTIGHALVKGIRLTVSSNDTRRQEIGTLCRQPDGENVKSVDVYLPKEGQVTLECPGRLKTWFFHFLTFGEGVVYRFDNIELLN